MLITESKGVDKKRKIHMIFVWRRENENGISKRKKNPNRKNEKESAGYRLKNQRNCQQNLPCQYVDNSYH